MKYKTWTESAHLQGFTRDGRTGFVARIQRYPMKSRDWLWLHLFHDGVVHGFVEEHLPGTRDITRVDAPDCSYRVGTEKTPGFAMFRRGGLRTEPIGVTVLAAGMGHKGPDVPEGAGTVEMRLTATFTPGFGSGSSAEGRTEVAGTVVGTLGIGKKAVELAGVGHWHEHPRPDPRFDAPFTNLRLTGEGLVAFATRTPAGVSGFVRRGDAVVAVTAFAIGPAGARRSVVLEDASGERITCVVADAYRYAFPIEGTSRSSSVVTAVMDGVEVVGTVDDWMAEAFPAELAAL